MVLMTQGSLETFFITPTNVHSHYSFYFKNSNNRSNLTNQDFNHTSASSETKIEDFEEPISDETESILDKLNENQTKNEETEENDTVSANIRVERIGLPKDESKTEPKSINDSILPVITPTDDEDSITTDLQNDFEITDDSENSYEDVGDSKHSTSAADSLPDCPPIPPNLVGRLFVNLTDVDWQELESIHGVNENGEFRPPDCEPGHHGTIRYNILFNPQNVKCII